jgi:hypothetical protein
MKVIFGLFKKKGPKDIFLLVRYSYVEYSYIEVLLYSSLFKRELGYKQIIKADLTLL